MNKIQLRKQLTSTINNNYKLLTADVNLALLNNFIELWQIIEQNINISTINVVAGYYPMSKEASCLAILNYLQLNNFVTALPKIPDTGRKLLFIKWQTDNTVTTGKFNIQEPVANIELAPDCVIVPMLGFDKSGNRLGHGGGYYDYTISHLRNNAKPKLLVIGLAFNFQEVDYIETNRFDVKLNALVTNQSLKIFNLGVV